MVNPKRRDFVSSGRWRWVIVVGQIGKILGLYVGSIAVQMKSRNALPLNFGFDYAI